MKAPLQLTSEDFDDFAGLPLLEWVDVKISRWHPKSVPFGDRPMHRISTTAGRVVGVEERS